MRLLDRSVGLDLPRIVTPGSRRLLCRPHRKFWPSRSRWSPGRPSLLAQPPQVHCSGGCIPATVRGVAGRFIISISVVFPGEVWVIIPGTHNTRALWRSVSRVVCFQCVFYAWPYIFNMSAAKP